MKTSVKLMSLLFCLSVVSFSYQSRASTPDEPSPPAQQDASKEKWEYYAFDEEGTEYSYDPHTLKHMKGNLVKVWVRAVYSEKSPKYSQAELQWEIDCAKKSMRGLTAQAKKKDGTQENIKTPSQWSAIPSESTAEMLYDTVCKKKEKKMP